MPNERPDSFRSASLDDPSRSMVAMNVKRKRITKYTSVGWIPGVLLWTLCLLEFFSVVHQEEKAVSFPLLDLAINTTHYSHIRPPVTRASSFSAPHHCGVVFFYHIGGTGGSSFRKYLSSYKGTRYPFYHKWAIKPHPSGLAVAKKFVEQVEKRIQNLTTTSLSGWKVLHSHHWNFGMNETAPLLQDWKFQVENIQKCKFLMTTIVREPLDHFLAKFRYKKINTTNLQHSILVEKQSQLEYFMYNWMRQNDTFSNSQHYVEVDNVTEKVRRALQIVDQYYDIVVMDSNVTKAEEAVDAWTQWPKHVSVRGNTGKDSMFSKSDIRKIWKFLDASGDFEFYRQLKLRQASD